MSASPKKSPIRRGTVEDVPVILGFIKELAEYEHETDKVLCTESMLAKTIFGPTPYAKVLIAQTDEGVPAGFALYFYNYSTWNGKPGIYLEDLYVQPKHRGKSFGSALLYALAEELVAIDGGRLEWSVLKWNTPSIEFYQRIGANPMTEWQMMRVDGDTIATLANKSSGILE
ncbi:N-acetyltransferase-like protein [Myxozyma melibiosi]|uniref:N-acetyltransferase-like protein n=1 Tax=Myxozyma melibiosi TaxID=54550 RepID=A0ABR1F2M3_9ASCO